MSGSAKTPSTVFVSDSPKEIATKINKFAFSGGRQTLEEHREKGADLEVDVSYCYLSYLLDDEEELKKIGTEYKAGRMLTGEVKARLIKLLTEMCQHHQKKRAEVTDELVRHFCDPTRPTLRHF